MLRSEGILDRELRTAKEKTVTLGAGPDTLFEEGGPRIEGGGGHNFSPTYWGQQEATHQIRLTEVPRLTSLPPGGFASSQGGFALRENMISATPGVLPARRLEDQYSTGAPAVGRAPSSAAGVVPMMFTPPMGPVTPPAPSAALPLTPLTQPERARTPPLSGGWVTPPTIPTPPPTIPPTSVSGGIPGWQGNHHHAPFHPGIPWSAPPEDGRTSMEAGTSLLFPPQISASSAHGLGPGVARSYHLQPPRLRTDSTSHDSTSHNTSLAAVTATGTFSIPGGIPDGTFSIPDTLRPDTLLSAASAAPVYNAIEQNQTTMPTMLHTYAATQRREYQYYGGGSLGGGLGGSSTTDGHAADMRMVIGGGAPRPGVPHNATQLAGVVRLGTSSSGASAEEAFGGAGAQEPDAPPPKTKRTRMGIRARRRAQRLLAAQRENAENGGGEEEQAAAQNRQMQ